MKNIKRGGIIIHFSVPDVDAYYQHLKAQGLTLHEHPTNRPWKLREFKVVDPDAYEIEIVGPII